MPSSAEGSSARAVLLTPLDGDRNALLGEPGEESLPYAPVMITRRSLVPWRMVTRACSQSG